MSAKNREHLAEVGKIKKNEISKNDDTNLSEIMQSLAEKMENTWARPMGYTFVWEPTLRYEQIKEYLSANGIKEEDVTYICHETRDGKIPTIRPDGGVISLVKTDTWGNIINRFIVLTSENKFQGTENTQKKHQDGNAEERLFKNFNVIETGVFAEDIFPYVIFGYGSAFGNENVLNAVRGGARFELNQLNIHKNSLTKVCPIMLREEKWRDYEITTILENTARQSMDYYNAKLGA